MKVWALVHQDHYAKYCERHTLSQTDSSLQQFLSDIGTPSLSFQPLNDASFKEVPVGSCIRLRLQGDYSESVHKKLFQALCENGDKSQRATSCSIV